MCKRISYAMRKYPHTDKTIKEIILEYDKSTLTPKLEKAADGDLV